MNRKKWIFVALLMLFFYLLVLQTRAIWSFTIDDMYISLRYAKHWAEGLGLLWNRAEEPVEGYSNFSFVVFAALAIHWGFNPVFVLKSLGIVGLGFSTVAVYCLTRLWFPALLALIPCVWMLLYSGQIIWAVSGLELTLYQALISFSVFFLFRGMGYTVYPRERQASNGLFFMLAGVLLALSGLTRPEAPALMLLFYGLAVWDRDPQKSRLYYKNLGLSILSCALFFVPYFLWRWNYYGQLVPNPIYCKVFSRVATLRLDKNYLQLAWPFFLLSLPALVPSQDKRPYFLWLPSLLYLFLLLGADPLVAFANRLFLPAFILLLPLAFLGLARWVGAVSPMNLGLSAGLVAFFCIPSMSLHEYEQFAHNPSSGEHLRQEVADWLNQNIQSGSHVLLADCGLIPYVSALQFVDSYCLNNKAMAHAPKESRYQQLCREMMINKPEVIILTSLVEKEHVIYTPTDQCLSRQLKTSSVYQFRTAFQTEAAESFYRYEIYTL